jgi:hypothetical protein
MRNGDDEKFQKKESSGRFFFQEKNKTPADLPQNISISSLIAIITLSHYWP